jgi:hypothetical protein
MFAPLAALLLAASTTSPTAPDSTAADTAAHRRIVREFEPIVVVGGRRTDPRSIEMVQPITTESLRHLAVDRFSDAVGLQAGVVASGEDLHVRGGRAGELVVSVAGVPLNEPRRGVAMEVPLFAVRTAELLSGGLDADHAGSLAGELDVQTELPTRAPAGLVRWTSDGRQGTGFDAVHARASGPIPRTGLGLVAAGEVRLDDLGLPALRSQGRTNFLGGSFGWRQDNHLLGWAKLAPLERPQRASLEVLASRLVRQPYDPMFSFDGWVSFEPDGPSGPNGEPAGRPLATSDHQLDPSYFRYRGADHAVMTEERRLAVIGTLAGGDERGPRRLTIGWLQASSLTSVGLRHDTGYTAGANRPIFGPYNYRWADPFHAYYGDESYYRDAASSRWLARFDGANVIARRHRLRYGAGVSYEWSRLYEVDNAAPWVQRVDTLRTYQAWAPAEFAYVQHRWEFGGLTWNAGLRVQSFTAGPQANGAPTIWSWSPRLGFAYPVSDRDAFSLAYSRVFQDPPRDLLYDNRRLIYDRHPLGNGALTPSEVISYQAAIKHILDPRWSLQLGVFYRDVYGEPGTRIYEPRLFTYLLRFESVDDAHASGVELSLVRDWPEHQHLEISYTFMNAWGAQSNLEGLAYGTSLGARPVPTGEHPLDWDERHALAVSAQVYGPRGASLSWSTRVATGLPWTPLERQPGSPDTWPPAYEDQTLINSRRLPWNENTNVALRVAPRQLHGARVMVMVTNLFDNRTERLATLSGFPNPIINTLYDEYGAYRTETGLGGGAYWNDANGDGRREWIPVNDRRLAATTRALRIGIELGL